MATARDFALQENRSAYIQAGWATGDHQEYQDWEREHQIDKDLAEKVLELFGIDKNAVRGEEADYGGGSDAAHFYDIPGAVVGFTTTGIAWFCRKDETIPDVTNYQESNQEANNENHQN